MEGGEQLAKAVVLVKAKNKQLATTGALLSEETEHIFLLLHLNGMKDDASNQRFLGTSTFLAHHFCTHEAYR